VRRAAYETLRLQSTPFDPTLLGASLLCLEEKDAELRRLALVSIPRQVDSEVARRLRLVIGRDAFDDWDYYDKRRAFLAYAASAGASRAAKDLVEVVNARGIFSSDALEDRRCAAVIALASLGDEKQLPVIEGEAKRMFAGKRIKEACEAAVAMLKFQKPLEDEASSAVPAMTIDDDEPIALGKLPAPIWLEIEERAR